MTEDRDLLGDTDYGRLGLKKLGQVPEGFRFYRVERLGRPPHYTDAIKLTGGVFREAKRGVNKGRRTVLVEDSEVDVIFTQAELLAFNAQAQISDYVATLRINEDGTHAVFLTETNSLGEYLDLIGAIGAGEHKLALAKPQKQPWPDHNWCVGCTPDECSGCGTEPYERRKAAAASQDCSMCPNNRDVVCAYCENTGIMLDTEGVEWPCPQKCEKQETASAMSDDSELHEDTLRLNWLQENFFECTLDGIDRIMHPNMVGWRFYGKKGLMASVRRIIDDRRKGSET